MKQGQRTKNFCEFGRSQRGILITTNVAARGLDIPDVDWIVQYDPPDCLNNYIHRVGRTARAGSQGNALLFLLPEEAGYLKRLKDAKVRVNEFAFPDSKVMNIQEPLMKLMETQHALRKMAEHALKSYLRAYASQEDKMIFDVSKLNMRCVARAFGFRNPPRVQLELTGGRRQRDKYTRSMDRHRKR